MAQSKKAIKLRIKSVKNTRKITKAMELVAASKMRRAVQAAVKSRAYAETITEAMRSAAASAPEGLQNILLSGNPKAKKTLLVLFSADRGLAGGLNVNLARKALEFVRAIGKEEVEVIALGKRGGDAMDRAGVKVIARFPALSNNATFADLLPAARMALDAFINGEYKKVSLGFTHFISGIAQRPETIDLLPFHLPDPQTSHLKPRTTTFEPSASEVFDKMLPAVARTMLWQALLESTASEHAARMVAMKSASDAAGEMLDALTFTYNQARQAGITQEIAEISSGKAALE
jgi:F-type H+-transporting ATPase subunit gamma